MIVFTRSEHKGTSRGKASKNHRDRLIETNDLARSPCRVSIQIFRAARVTRNNGPRVPDTCVPFLLIFEEFQHVN